MSQMTGNTNHISIITLNVNGLNSLIKRHRLADWIKKKTQKYAAFKKLINSSYRKRYPQTKGERIGKNILYTWTQ